MRMTPLDIQKQRFRSRWRGLDAEDVATFLAAVSEDYAGLLQELATNDDQIRRLEARVEELSLNESLLKETLVTAQNLGDELRGAAQQQASVQIGEAEVKAEKILDAAHRRAGRLGEEISELRGLRSRLAASMRTSLETHLALVEALDIDPEHPTTGRATGLEDEDGKTGPLGPNSGSPSAT